jgi:ubiquinone/menaquinone biosynthesis C-methylase UbiE
MQRVDSPEILDTDGCPPEEVQVSLRDLDRVNRWFGGVSTTQKLIERVAQATGKKQFSLLEVAAGLGKLPELAAKRLTRRGIRVEVTLLDRAWSHLGGHGRRIAGDALSLPCHDGSFDLVSCNLFAHHLNLEELVRFAGEGLRVCRCAVLINDLIRHPLHLALVYAGFPLMRSHVSRVDGVASVRRAYVPEEMRRMLGPVVPDRCLEITRHYLFRMGVVVWKEGGGVAARKNLDPSLRSG